MFNRRLMLLIILDIITGMAAVGDDGVEIFKKTLPTGCVATVVKTTMLEKGNPARVESPDVPPGAIRVSGFPVRIYNCIMRIREKNGNDVIAWQKEMREPEIEERRELREFTIHDIVEKEDQIAILSTAYYTEIEVLGQNEQKGYETRWRRSLFHRSDHDPVYNGRLSWLDDLYVLILTNTGGTGVWRKIKDELVTIFKPESLEDIIKNQLRGRWLAR
jgi:hypothetical protein